jgi:hypothetical protein
MLPFIREVIASTTLRAGVPPIMLPPLNVHAMAKTKVYIIIKKPIYWEMGRHYVTAPPRHRDTGGKDINSPTP